MRISKDNITKLEPNQIFVFGSNLSGRHGKGAAKTALGFGAKWGQGVGLQGNSYGIPTKPHSVREVLPLNKIKEYVDEFIEFAKSRKDLEFHVTLIGCGLAGYKPREIKHLFKEALELENVYLPKQFI